MILASREATIRDLFSRTCNERCSTDPKNICAVAHAPTPRVSFKLRAFIYNSMLKKKVTERVESRAYDVVISLLYGRCEKKKEKKNTLRDSQRLGFNFILIARFVFTYLLSLFSLLIFFFLSFSANPSSNLFSVHLALSSPVNFSRSYPLYPLPPAHSLLRVLYLLPVLYYSLPPAAFLFILARGELRDDNGKSKGFKRGWQKGEKAKRAEGREEVEMGQETRGIHTREREQEREKVKEE